MNTFYNKHVVRSKSQLVSTLFAASRLEIIARKVQVEGMYAFIVVIAFLVTWCPLAVNEIVVE